MIDLPFVGRERHLEKLQLLLNKKTATLAVVKGRRRIGKSRLIEEFAKDYRFLEFAGLFPDDGVTVQDQRDVFARQLSTYSGLPMMKGSADWMDAFQMLANITQKGRVIILLDEISWMAMDDPTFLAKLKNIWDLELKKNPELILILCGSVSVWIERYILMSTGFFGRIPVTISLDELSLYNCNKLLEAQNFIGSPYEKFMLLAITGGIPYYLEQLQPGFNAEQNIRHLCFTEDALFVKEFEKIFHDVFDRKSDMYRKIISLLANGSADYNKICETLNYAKSGRMNDYLQELIIAKFVSRDYTWAIKNGRPSRLSKFRLSDNYLRFYLKYIEPASELINQGMYEKVDFMSMDGWSTIMGLQFENLVLKNRKKIINLLGINPAHIVASNPFFQRKTARQKGVQIDYLIQTKFKTLFAVEIRFSRNELNVSIVTEMKDKINRLSLPRGFSCFPVLIHVNGVSDAVLDLAYFTKIIDFSELLSS